MQILYLIGNGFDVNLNMKTRYTDFYETYKKIETESIVLKNLKKNIVKKVNTWSDLEFRLGEYTENIKTYEEFSEIYEDLLEKFGNYLQDIEDQVDWKSVNFEKFKTHLCFPEKSLMQKEINIIDDFKNKFYNNSWLIDVITFNYTRSIEKLLGENFNSLILGKHHDNMKIILNSVLHIHGDLNNMVLGINDISQLKNNDFHNNKKILKALIKENNNRRQGHTVDEILETKILKANLICVFGSSIGETDKIWWEKIGKRLLTDENCKLIIFTYVEIKTKRAIHIKGDFEDDLKEIFFKRANLNENEQEKINDRIFVRANTDMFSSLVNEKVIKN